MLMRMVLNLLELTRKYCPNAVFIFTSSKYMETNQITYHLLRLIFLNGIDEEMTDDSLHSIFGASKIAAEKWLRFKYFGLKTFRG